MWWRYAIHRNRGSEKRVLLFICDTTILSDSLNTAGDTLKTQQSNAVQRKFLNKAMVFSKHPYSIYCLMNTLSLMMQRTLKKLAA